jgi:hypothetical protein
MIGHLWRKYFRDRARWRCVEEGNRFRLPARRTSNFARNRRPRGHGGGMGKVTRPQYTISALTCVRRETCGSGGP